MVSAKEKGSGSKHALGRVLDWLMPLASVALLVPLGVRWFSPGGAGGTPLVLAHGEGLRLLSPAGDMPRYTAVEWDLLDEELRPGDRLFLEVYDDEDYLRLEPLFEHELNGSPWADPDQQSLWPNSVFLRLEVRRASLEEGPWGWSRASRIQ